MGSKFSKALRETAVRFHRVLTHGYCETAFNVIAAGIWLFMKRFIPWGVVDASLINTTK